MRRSSSSMQLMQRQTPKPFTRSSRSASANSLPLLATLVAHDMHDMQDMRDMHEVVVGKDEWDMTALGEAYPVVPVNNLFKCGSVHAFPMSLLSASSSSDVQGVALCLASPVVDEDPNRETREVEHLVRRLSYMGNNLWRRKWAEVLKRR